MFFLFGLWVLKRFVPLVRRSQYLDARGQRLKIEFRMTRLQVPVAPVLYGTVIDIFPYLWFPCTYTYPSHHSITVVLLSNIPVSNYT
jgi:hypothetical protein